MRKKKSGKRLTQSKGESSPEPPVSVSGMFKSKSFWSVEDANSAIFNNAVPIAGTLFFGLWFNPCNIEWIQILFSEKKNDTMPCLLTHGTGKKKKTFQIGP